MRFPVFSVLKPLAVRIRSEGTNDENMFSDAAVDEDEGIGGGGTGRRNDDWCSFNVESCEGELPAEDAEEVDEDDDGVWER